MQQEFSIEPIKQDSADLQSLVAQSDAYMGALYPVESNHLESVHTLLEANALLLGVFARGQMVGCGAVKILRDDGDYGEIKRVFVLNSERGKGISKAIMHSLERHLLDSGIRIARLETGIKQPEAIGLYKSLGYIERAPFGKYRPDPLSLFMEKRFAS